MLVKRFYTKQNESPYASIEFRTVSSEIRNPDGSIVFSLADMEVPADWSQVACDVLAQKYFRKAGVPQHLKRFEENDVPSWLWRCVPDKEALAELPADHRTSGETSAKQVFNRLAGTWTYWGWKGGYFDSEEDARIYMDEMRYMLAKQVGAPNSPQWFNTGLYWAYGIDGPAQGHHYVDYQSGELTRSTSSYEHPQPHACFIQSVDDDLVNDNGIMVVNQTPEVHAMINALLQDLREATGIMVDIHVRFMKVEDNFLEDVGIDFRGLGAPGVGTAANFNDFGDAALPNELGDSPGGDSTLGAFLDEGADGDVKARVEDLYDTQLGSDTFQAAGGLSFQWTLLSDMQLELILRAVSKSERIELVTAPRITVHNTSRAHLSVLNQVAYIKDFDVEIAQAASIADPIIEVIQDGVILDVRPVVSADRRFVTLELRPTIAQLKRPIEERVTTLGSQNSVTIMLPEVEIQRVRTSVPLPDGGTVLLGGMKESEKQSQRSGVPILNKIPILSLFFERKGTFISNRKLLILLRANILIPTELAPTPAEMGLTP
mgnify:CR=1 FL=1